MNEARHLSNKIIEMGKYEHTDKINRILGYVN